MTIGTKYFPLDIKHIDQKPIFGTNERTLLSFYPKAIYCDNQIIHY